MITMPPTHVVPIHLDLGTKTLKEANNEEISAGMDPELRAFQEWFHQKGNGPLIGVERSILKTYLAWKLIYETAGQDPQT